MMRAVVVRTNVKRDVDGDGKSDLVWWNGTSGQLYTWFMAGATYVSSPLLATRTAPWGVVAIADFDNDGRAEVLWRNTTTGQIELQRVNGTGATASSGGFTPVGILDASWTLEGVTDIDGNGTADLFWRNSASGQIYFWYMNGATYTSSALIDTVPTFWKVEGIADVDGDSQEDIIWRNAVNGQMYIWHNSYGKFVSSNLVTVLDVAWKAEAIGDFDGDGKADVLWRHATTNQMYIWFFNGNTWTSSNLLGIQAQSWQVVSVGDTDASGKAEIVWRGSNGDVYSWRIDRATSTFTSTPRIARLDATWVTR